ncbi:bifunctional adenosylcobinamide kinase/adenosylcobinamide-phosphate guanylyltransferase [Blautia sp. MSJ-19]|uniref:bifunctional adenosylcobinamide kinase/adenosylcobinamide-phosphate guanylyltransferase n=1 Tax=Blautia sp. MSJ-19 TaxID=2841517 RepID=UPI001C0F1110|nr:bifunctional adenosylcobinamide kinase/adenosylcobinamide-phosphate guanylyltransferase [Blautia sp. MSJ-19]MBU5482347.1 bifunctional adenosylcobinamide kinase/adenosylcobinamide-phosphate guanylyltransferase [Blautia sp. MSJ-19]
MKMIIGGAFQGKSALAKKEYPKIDWVNGEEADWAAVRKAQGILNFHAFIRREMKEGKDVRELAEWLIDCNPEVILVSDEVGYGVVPMDAFDRAYREAVGRICTKLAAYSCEVTRVVCGIGTVIKHA